MTAKQIIKKMEKDNIYDKLESMKSNPEMCRHLARKVIADVVGTLFFLGVEEEVIETTLGKMFMIKKIDKDFYNQMKLESLSPSLEWFIDKVLQELNGVKEVKGAEVNFERFKIYALKILEENKNNLTKDDKKEYQLNEYLKETEK
jgi:uncharacterized membrane-anchored protein YjiN (DUF445 family)